MYLQFFCVPMSPCSWVYYLWVCCTVFIKIWSFPHPNGFLYLGPTPKTWHKFQIQNSFRYSEIKSKQWWGQAWDLFISVKIQTSNKNNKYSIAYYFLWFLSNQSDSIFSLTFTVKGESTVQICCTQTSVFRVTSSYYVNHLTFVGLRDWLVPICYIYRARGEVYSRQFTSPWQ